MDLFASWKRAEDEYYEVPDVVRWADGSKATLDDYAHHVNDTQRWVENSTGRRELQCTDVIAIVSYDAHGGVWGAKGDGVEPKGLDLCDPNASDDQIYAALNSGEWTYRMHIVR